MTLLGRLQIQNQETRTSLQSAGDLEFAQNLQMMQQRLKLYTVPLRDYIFGQLEVSTEVSTS